ncbi:MAG: alpha-ribazole phosphatase [Bacteroidota bacterium]
MIRTFRWKLLTWICLIVPIGVHAQLEKVEAFYQNMAEEKDGQPVTLSFVQPQDSLVEDYSQLYQIVLLRHGEPALDKTGKRKRSGAVQYVHDYDMVGIYPPAFIPLTLQDDELTFIYTSSLNRSISTAQKVFNLEELHRPKSLFREFERKVFAFPNIKLPLKWWLIGSRVMWLMGFNNRGIEGFGAAKRRAKIATRFLEQDAYWNGKTLLVSHGLLNHYLFKYLEKRGWTVVYDGGKGYLSQKMLVKYGKDN